MKREKLPLRPEGGLIEKAERFARDRATSVSSLVESFFENLADPEPESKRYGPITNRLRGSLAAEKDVPQAGEEDYPRHLEEKHG